MFENVQVNIAGGLDLPIPKMAKVRQIFETHRVDDVATSVREQLDAPDIGSKISPGAKIAIGVGSRGVANIGEAVGSLVSGIVSRGGEPFVFPAMGSHGGATVEGQTEVLANYGITEARIGAPIRATMDTVVVAELDDGTPLHMDRNAREADGVVLINRIKPHTTFRGDIESGIVKMMVIGMGKINGATVIHNQGMDRFAEVLPVAAELIMQQIPFLFGVALVEDAYENTAIVEAIPPERLVAHESELQARSKELMARLYFEDIDVLVIDRMGKEISGAGFDPNITGRNNRGVVGFERPRVKKIVVLDLSDQTHGNACGIGVADVITQKLFNRIDIGFTYANVITSAYLDGGLIPIVMPTEKDAVRLAIKTLLRVKPQNARIVRIKDTLTLGEILVSEAMLDEVRDHGGMEIMTDPEEMFPEGN